MFRLYMPAEFGPNISAHIFNTRQKLTLRLSLRMLDSNCEQHFWKAFDTGALLTRSSPHVIFICLYNIYHVSNQGREVASSAVTAINQRFTHNIQWCIHLRWVHQRGHIMVQLHAETYWSWVVMLGDNLDHDVVLTKFLEYHLPVVTCPINPFRLSKFFWPR